MRALVIGVRWVLPLVLAAIGVGFLIVGGDIESGAGVSALMLALTVVLISLFLRGSIVSNRDREEEERAREHFDRHGRWPDDA